MISIFFSYKQQHLIYAHLMISKMLTNVFEIPPFPAVLCQMFLTNSIKTRQLLNIFIIIGFFISILTGAQNLLKLNLIRFFNWKKQPIKLVFFSFNWVKQRSYLFFTTFIFFFLSFFLKTGFTPMFFGFKFGLTVFKFPLLYHPFLLPFVQKLLKSTLVFKFYIYFFYSTQIFTSYTFFSMLNLLRFLNWPLARLRNFYLIDWRRYIIYKQHQQTFNYIEKPPHSPDEPAGDFKTF